MDEAFIDPIAGLHCNVYNGLNSAKFKYPVDMVEPHPTAHLATQQLVADHWQTINAVRPICCE